MTGFSFEDAAEHLIETVPGFAVGTADIRGTRFRVFTGIPQTLPELLKAGRDVHGGGAAEYLAYEDERWSYDAFCAEVRALAHALENRGIRKGDRVAIAMRNYPEFLTLFMAISSLGATIVFLNAWWTAEELDYALHDSAPVMIFADEPRMARLLELRNTTDLRLVGIRDGESMAPERYSDLHDEGRGADWANVDIDTDDDFGIMYSSGTTGNPKGVVLTHRGAVNAVYTWLFQAAMVPLMAHEPVEPDPVQQVVLVATPLFHVTATHPVFLCSLPAGAKIVLINKWDAGDAVRLIHKERVTRFIGVPTQSADLMEAAKSHREQLDTLQLIAAGGAKRPAAQVGPLAEAFPKAQVATGWGMTETNAIGVGVIGSDYVARPGCAGRLYPPLQELRFLDDAGHDVPTGEIGEMTVKSPSNMREYLNKPDATTEVLHDGWLRTGDLGFIDPQGFITIVDRSKNIIIRGGENIACLDVEAALHTHPAVAEACAFPVPHDRLVETVGAAVQIRLGHQVTAEDLCAHLGRHVAHFKVPDYLWLQPDPLPRGATAKLDRRGLRDSCLKNLNKGRCGFAPSV